MAELTTLIDLSSTWLARGKVTRDTHGGRTIDVEAVQLSQEHGILTGPEKLRIFTRPLMADEVSQRFKTVELSLGVPEAFDQCTELYCWAISEESATNRLYIRLRSQ